MKTVSSSPFIKTAWLAVLSFCLSPAFAVQDDFEPVDAPKSGNNIQLNALVSAKDPQLDFMEANSPWGFTNVKARAQVYARIKHHETTFVSAYDYEVQVEVKYKTHVSGTTFSTTTIDTVSLFVSYDPTAAGTYRDLQTFVAEDAYWIQAKILDVRSGGNSVLGSVAANLEVGAKGTTERYYNPAPTTLVGGLTTSLVTSGSELEVEWNAWEGVEWYDLEWAYIDDYDGAGAAILPGAIPYDNTVLDSSSTRVRLRGLNSYRIPLIYGQGYIVYRVRPVWRVGSNFKQVFEGRWTDHGQSTVTNLGQISNKYRITGIHEQLLNWQYTATYAENGKRKEVVRYFDGTLRERQAVTKLYEQNETVVAEKIYDHQGRPAMEMLPVPTNSPVMQYYRKFNINTSGGPYTRSDFDLDAGSCGRSIDGVSSESGAGLYYGTRTATNGRDTSGLEGYVPNAGGYPFVVTEYTPDQTGRIRQQSGVGPDHQLDGDHSTRYYYSQPEQQELDRLFGTEIGYMQHYKKIMTIDPNGQVSITYQDLSGKTMATALAGPSPNNLSKLPSNTGGDTDTRELIDDNRVEKDWARGLFALEVVFPFVVTQKGDVEFDYSMTPDAYEEACISGLCLDCVYRITISVKDECGQEMLNGGTHIETIGTINETCSTPSTYSLSGNDFIAEDLLPGQYTVTKTLYVDQDAAEVYADMYMANQTCLKSYDEFLYPIIDSMRIDEQCADPDTCTTGDCFRIGTCETFLTAMIADMAPGGQYAGYTYNEEDGSYSVSAGDYPLSILTSSNQLPGQPYWKDVSNYKTATGEDATIYWNGSWVEPQDLPLKEFVENFELSWAKSLVQYHPEYCYYQWCAANQASMTYDSLMMVTESFQEAWDLGLFNPLNLPDTYGVPDTLFDQSYTPQYDPFFVNGQGNPVDSLHDTMSNEMLAYFTYSSTNVSMWQLATVLTHCGSISSLSELNICWSNTMWGRECPNDRLWELYRGMYLSQKFRLYERARTNYAIENDCYNGCIGNESFTGSEDDFDDYAGYDHYNNNSNQPCYVNTAEYYAEKHRIFPRAGDLFKFDPYTEPDLSDVDSSMAIAQENIDNSCDSACMGYADHWISALEGCGLTDLQKDTIRSALIDVCILGCDENNPYGASSTPTGQSTADGYTSFESVLNTLVPGYDNSNVDCTADLIGFPKPYNHGYHGGNGTQYPVLDTCACTWLMDYSDEYDNATGLPAHIKNLEDYIAWKTDIEFFHLDERLCKCEEYWDGQSETWEPDAQDSLQSSRLYIPADIVCPTCLTCDTIQVAMDSIFARYGTSLDTATYRYRILPNYLNDYFGMNLTFPEYVEFVQACDSIGSSGQYIQEEHTSEADGLEWLLEALMLNGYFQPETNEVWLGQFEGLIGSSLLGNISDPRCWKIDLDWENPVPNLQKLIDHGASETQGHRVTISLIDTCNLSDTCSIELQFKESYTYGNFTDPDNVVGQNLYVDELYSETCPYYDFIFYIGSDTLYGASTCHPVTHCASDITLCNRAILALGLPEDDCRKTRYHLAAFEASRAYKNYKDSLRATFIRNYNEFCLGNKTESFTKTDTVNEYHYTLYYYDRAGNLSKTIPPAAVSPLTNAALLDSVIAYRDSVEKGASYIPDTVQPAHNFALASTYQYNSFNQVFKQTTPDGGTNEFWYDNKGRLAASQNAKQQATARVFPNDPQSYYQYSYTQFDPLGRIAEVGQIYALSDPTPTQINNANWPFIWGHNEEEVVRIRYDIPLGGIPSDIEQKNLRNRVATTHYDDDGIDEYDYATHYTYDAHGNVDTLWQEYVPLADIEQDLKKIAYSFDLVSGNVKEVAYQRGHTDQFFHRYTYDSDNRITEVQTSRDGIIWDRDAGYGYNRHGLLARMELGEHNVQGVDYAYTIHGWIKGVNSNVLSDTTDIGRDGNPNGDYGTFAYDAFGYSLGYYEGDYIPINQRHTEASQNYFLAATDGSEFGNASADLWNGNIRHMVTSLVDDNNTYLTPQGTAYRYDQLNRLTRMQVFQGITSNEWDASGSSVSQHGVDSISYDASGNILSLLRSGNLTGADFGMDTLTYNYYSNTNKLEYVGDLVPSGRYGNDIDDQSAGNYDYDEIGNLVSDDAGSISQIQWYVNGKVRAINRSGPTQSQPNLKFAYGPDGQRIRKAVTWISGGDTTWYVRDAQGNVMAVYRERNDSLFVKEHYIYGSSRLGSIHDWTFVTSITAHSDSNRYSRVLGKKNYELSNHLGNVLATVTDQKKAHDNSGSVDYWEPTVASYSDYFPFGMIMAGRSGGGTDEYRYGFQGQETDDEINGSGNSYSFTYRVYDPRLGRFVSTDPMTSSYPYWTPYQYAGLTPIWARELEGLEPAIPINEWAEHRTYSDYNYYNQGGYLEKVDGWWVHSTTDNEGVAIHRYYNYMEERWIKFHPIPPKINCLSCDLRLILSPRGLWMITQEYGHETLDAAGLVPLIGEVADGLNAIWYYAEGDAINGTLSLAGMVPFAGWAATGAKYSLKVGSKVVNNADDFYRAVSKLDIPERIAKFREVGREVAQHNGWVKNTNLMKKNGNKYEIYTDPKDGKHYSLDIQHGHFEVLNRKGKHQGAVDFDGRHVANPDSKGGHDIIVK